MRQLVEGLAWESGWEQAWEVPSKVAIYKARQRLGREPLELLFKAVAVPLASDSTRGAFYRGLRLMSVDGTCLGCGRYRAKRGRRSGGRARIAVRAAARSRSCAWWRWRSRARTRSSTRRSARTRALSGRWPIGCGARWRRGCCALPTVASTASSASRRPRGTGAQLLWRVKLRSRAAPRADAPGRLVSDPASTRREPQGRKRRRARQARVVEYRLDDPALGDEDQRYRLITTILDPERHPRASSPRSTRSAGSSSQHSMSSRPTSAARASCCAQSIPTASTRRPTDTSAPTTRSGA